MARSPSDQAAVSRAKGLMEHEVISAGGKKTIRVAVRHTDADHPCATTFHYGPAFTDETAGIIAHVRGCSPSDVDLTKEARVAADRAREEYPEAQGWEVSLEAIVPHEDNVGDENDKHVVRRIEEG